MSTKSNWINCAVKPEFSWPNCEVEIPFEDRIVVLQPKKENLAATASVYDEAGLSFSDGGALLFRFLSRLAWSMNGGVVENYLGGSNHSERPGLMAQGTYGSSGWSQVDPWKYLYLPKPSTEKGELALALYREAMSLNSVPYTFLGYFKILNISFSLGSDQKRWINDNLHHVIWTPETDRINELKTTESDIGAYLYHQGRCAVAHAFSNEIVNPDNYDDKRRLDDDLRLMKALASLCIETEFSIKTDSSFWESLKEKPAQRDELLVKNSTKNGRVIYTYYRTADNYSVN